MPSDDEDFVYYGSRIERAEEVTTRRKKATAEVSGQLRTALPPWKQEVLDEEGRRRFHGAFTGGFSAGYYNTVGSKEGWTPQTFTSSRKNRADVKKQNIYSFLDDEEKAELEARSLETSMQYDTFGFTAIEVARKQAQAEQQQRTEAVPGLVPDELVVPSAQSIGVKLLLKMGWRQGRSIKDSNKAALHDARREARKAFLAFSDNKSSQDSAPSINEEGVERDKLDLETEDDDKFYKTTPPFVINPKQDLHGLGYDPFKQAPEFREKKRLRMSGDLHMKHSRSHSIKGKMGPGFGIGALEDLDVEDEDVYTSGYNFEETYVQEVEEPSYENNIVLRITDKKKHDALPGFKASQKPDKKLERFDPPAIPEDFVPRHKFPATNGYGSDTGDMPPDVPAPEDSNLRVLIEGLAKLVARCGKLFEDLSRGKNQSNPSFGFLFGGNGSDFYARKLWEEQQKHGQQNTLWEGKISQKPERLTAEKRGKILGEKALEASAKDSSYQVSIDVQFKLSDTFTTPASATNHHNHSRFSDDPAKQKRFEQFLKEKYEGGLRSRDSGGASSMSEAARARERLEFEAAADAIKKENSVEQTRFVKTLAADFLAPGGLQFTTGAAENDKTQEKGIPKALFPKREEFEWRPAPILCKRFDLTDPYMGKPPPAPRSRSKLDTLIVMPTFEASVSGKQASSSVPQGHGETVEATDNEMETEVQAENIERPLDLYKAIFSDDSDDEAEVIPSIQPGDVQKKSEAANTALNRLIAGDFLESLGKELGLEVPPEAKLLENRADTGFADSGTSDQHSTPVERVRPNFRNEIVNPNNKQIVVNNDQDTQRVSKVNTVQGIADESNSRIPPSDKGVTRNRSHSRDSFSSEDDSRKRLKSHRLRRSKRSSSDSESDERGSRSRRHSKHSKRRKHHEHRRRKDKHR